MGNFLKRGAVWLAGQLKKHAANDVVYRRGASSVSLRATVGKTLLKLSDGYGGTKMQWTDRDYIIDPLDLVLDNVVVLPVAGDTIEETVNGDLKVFEVLSPGGGEDFYKLDEHQRLMRIHTKELA